MEINDAIKPERQEDIIPLLLLMIEERTIKCKQQGATLDTHKAV
jgi:hypothetical protein